MLIWMTSPSKPLLLCLRITREEIATLFVEHPLKSLQVDNVDSVAENFHFYCPASIFSGDPWKPRSC